MAIGGFLISSVYGSDTWPEKYVRKTNNKIWNLIQKRCSTALCKDHLNKLRTERLQSAGRFPEDAKISILLREPMRSVYDFVETQRAEPCLDAVLPLPHKKIMIM